MEDDFNDLSGMFPDLEKNAAGSVPESKSRASYVGAPAMFKLQTACATINQAFGDYGCYHVGSSLQTKAFRDVDVRFIMDDDKFAGMFPGLTNENMAWLHARWALLCASIADYLSAATGLPIDFQFQSQTFANKLYAPRQGHPRSALGMWLSDSA